MKAAQNGDFFDLVTIKYGTVTITLTGVVIAHAAQSSDGAISVRFAAKAVHRQIRSRRPDGPARNAPVRPQTQDALGALQPRHEPSCSSPAVVRKSSRSASCSSL